MESLFYIYIASLLVGGTVVVLSALGGLGGADLDVGGDLDVDADVGAEVELGTDAGDAGHGISFLSILKIRRLFFFAFFFGLTGLLVGLGAEPIETLYTAIGMGVLCAWLGDWIISKMTQSSASGSLEPEDYIGLEAQVTVPIAGGQRGKISGIIKGHTVELLAQASQEDQELTPGAKVLVLSLEDGVAVVDRQQ